MNEEEIQALIQAVIAEIKAAAQLTKRDESKLPKFRPTYEVEVEMADEIAVHSEVGEFPKSLFKKKAPNEDPEQWEYRKENYRPITIAWWNRFLSALNRIWNTNNYEIQWPDSEQSKYFLEDYPVHGSIISYFESVVTAKKINDPNSVIVVKPREIPTETNDAGEIVAVDNVLIEPMAYIYSSKDVIKSTDKGVLILTAEKSMVEYGNGKVKEGLIYELIDKENIWRIVQTGKKIDYTFTISVFYNHKLGYLPIWRLKGQPVYQDGELYFKSYFYDIVPLLNGAIYDQSTLDIIKVGAAFPVRWAVTETCDYTNDEGIRCDGTGKITTYDENNKATTKECPGCHGSGRKNPFTPMGVYQVKSPDNKLDNQNVITPPFGIVESSLTTLSFLEKSVELARMNASLTLNIDITQSQANGKETATGKLIDREELFSFMTLFSSEIFDLLGEIIEAIGQMRYGEKFAEPNISKPVWFGIHNEAELTDEISKAQQYHIPDLAIRRLMREYFSVRFTNSDDDVKLLDLAMQVDSFFTLGTTDIIAGLGAGYIQKWEAELHKNIFSYISDEDGKDPVVEGQPKTGFFGKTLQEQKEILIARAKADVEAAGSGFDAQKIIANAANKLVKA